MAAVSITSPIMHRLRILFLRFYPPPDSFLSILLFRLGPYAKIGECTLCAAASAHRPTVGHHRAMAPALLALPIERNSRVGKQHVEDAPCESTVSAATLQ